ncbi:F-type H+-transporting ATPase subunit delta [Saccharopolyspora antimicrobica]|uniref:ATP synthase subunit delta n=2 Tax=Saccharopolyspora TaxID=1835 RepID=A0A1I5KJC8_9PSEU|nr:ATP synthase F1 subcomplex delta subunit [Saccharopolyspora antimicrobica]SEG98270.1 ATP synthase F1 subcomplex delta subunit [Saccharopolyspora kobensis]SFE71181.1 ATP synthase F1 subcomplex delta subunit [Saccharopolyspora kobensis]SFO84661.1 F-type H+-transporting ATPase subunit delta [Saccharopolyspora antimicrobica]
MNAASREALAAAELQLLQATDGASAAEITGLADELFGVAALLGRESTLRRALADASVDPRSREDLVRGLLADKLGARSLPVVVEAARSRWSGPKDLVDGLERLARTALLVQAERAGRLDAVEDELFRLGRIIGSQVDLERLLSDPTGDEAGKHAVLDQLVAGKVEPVTLTLVRQLVARPRGRRVSEGLEELAELSAKRRERSVAHVRSAIPLSDEQQQRLSRALQRIYARPIALHIEVDPGVEGGLLIQIGDEVIDGSITGRLQSLRRDLAN